MRRIPPLQQPSLAFFDTEREGGRERGGERERERREIEVRNGWRASCWRRQRCHCLQRDGSVGDATAPQNIGGRTVWVEICYTVYGIFEVKGQSARGLWSRKSENSLASGFQSAHAHTVPSQYNMMIQTLLVWKYTYTKQSSSLRSE